MAGSIRKNASSSKKPAAPGSSGRNRKAPASKPVPGPALVPVWHLLLPDGSRLGEDRIQLLQAIDHTGCILEAAAICGISYRTAWSRVQELNANFEHPLLESVQGGAVGGSTRLSPEAARLLALHREATKLFQKAAAEQGLESSDANALDSFRQRLSMRTSVRNQYHGKVVSVTRGKVHAEIVLEIQGGVRLVSQVTLSSCDAMGLKPGVEAWALVKSTWVEIAVGADAPRVSARNVLEGTVANLRKGGINDEICLSVAEGLQVTGLVSAEATQSLGLRKGARAWALFKASSVILAVN